VRPAPSAGQHDLVPDARVVVADGNALSRRGLVTVLRDGGYVVVGEATTATWALHVLQSKNPDASEPWSLIAAVRRRSPGLAIVALGQTRSDEAMFKALSDGASGFAARSSMPSTILGILAQAISAPGAFIAEDLMAAQRRRARSRAPRMSARELEVLALLAEGLTVPAVAQRLFIAESTAKSHVSRIYVKLGVGSRSQALLAAIQLGMVPPPAARR
jgi:DNA-binding NarL/FixJ family response regulator